MNLSKVSDEEKLSLCRKYFIGGIFALPFLWLVNTVWFFREAFFRSAFEQQKKIRTYVTWSLVGCLVWTTALIAWITVYQVKRAEWGETGDRLSFIIPRGRP
ncbi:gamma-secretase subunit PEN-2-like [Lytechinus pictus]|uniref:gamma-secretase subunit PEN-2-like n=1 Tax=Lytechinus variegatus TaxID=7654 RepID=UPI001BB195CD|nr:gamma-secretase subunit PEN-2-like [Lytechinus variegatus]XP_054760601.1 gamma-secretase subunit PEN-2-like [Lytechinus pictus]